MSITDSQAEGIKGLCYIVIGAGGCFLNWDSEVFAFPFAMTTYGGGKIATLLNLGL